MSTRLLRDCPCHSGLRYTVCCGPYHRRGQEPTTPEALMRSRYAAFALGLGDYLMRTLTADHPDRAIGDETLAQQLSRTHDTQRFMGLRIVESKVDGDRGEVLFVANIFEGGRDRSFAERSQFRKERGAWRYASGEMVAPLPA